ncbi:MAG: ABC transporter permease, partial [Bryobacterales bacterium]|nr:ABC transporter permease [Bryobacterales bacterium]
GPDPYSGTLRSPILNRQAGLLATPEFFNVFRVPLLGRSFQEEDRGARRPHESTATGQALVLGNGIWRRYFDADSSLVGSAVDLYILNTSRSGPTKYMVVGAATAPVQFPPIEADFHLGGSTVVESIDFWMPQFVSPTQLAKPGPEDYWFDVVARLRPGVTLGQAQAEMDVIARLNAERFPESYGNRVIRILPLREHMAGGSRNGILLLLLGTAILLIIACSNVAALLLARGVARRSEIATHIALGAPSWVLVRRLLTEALIIATCAGVLGVLLAAWAISLAKPWTPPTLPLLQGAGINFTVMAFALTSVVATACIAGLAPALRSLRAAGFVAIGLDGRGATLGRLQSRLVSVLVSVEVALAIVLLVGTGLLVRSAVEASQVQTGFNQDNLITMTISLPPNKFDWAHNAVFAREVLEEVRSLPQVSAAAAVHGIPMGSGSYFSSGEGIVEGYAPANESEKPSYGIRIVSPGYFAAMQIPLVAGRPFEARDEEGQIGAGRSVLVSESFARRYWSGLDPLGRGISFGGDYAGWKMTVIGVAGNVRYSGLEMRPTVDIYIPLGLFPQSAVTLIARTRTDSLDVVASVRERIRDVDQHAFVTDIKSMDELVAESLAQRHAGTLFVSVFGIVALVLVVAGVYSVIAQVVVERRRDLAIRSALGAVPSRVIATAMRTALQPAIAGMFLGGFAALGTTRILTSVLFQVDAFDIVTWTGAFATLLVSCVGAGFVSGRRAARIDPANALRSE